MYHIIKRQRGWFRLEKIIRQKFKLSLSRIQIPFPFSLKRELQANFMYNPILAPVWWESLLMSNVLAGLQLTWIVSELF